MSFINVILYGVKNLKASTKCLQILHFVQNDNTFILCLKKQ